jgi:hypothetical protein
LANPDKREAKASSMNFDKWEFHNVIFPVEKGGASR